MSILHREDIEGPWGGTIGFRYVAWEVESKSDHRWDKKGYTTYGPPSKEPPREMLEWIAECRSRFGEPPNDMTSRFKDSPITGAPTPEMDPVNYHTVASLETAPGTKTTSRKRRQ